MIRSTVGLACVFLAACGEAPPTRLPGEIALRDALRIEPMQARPLPSRVFVSGHSLVDLPYPEYLAVVAAGLGQPLAWQRQYQFGSSIRQRSPISLPQGGIDALIITEQHGVLNSLVWEDTRRYLREAHDLFISRNPGGQTWFFMPWLTVEDTGNPERWMAYERAAAHVWQCTVSRVNADLSAAGNSSRIHVIPASLALVHLTDTLRKEGRPGVFSDDVHLTPAGKFYMALITTSYLSGGLPSDTQTRIGNDIPGLVPDDIAVMVRIALGFQERGQSEVALSEAGCRRYLADTFIDDYWRYYRKAVLARNSSVPRAWWSAWRMKQQSTRLLEGAQ